MEINSIIEKVAQHNNTSAEEVRNEIIHGMKVAMSSTDPDIQKKWASISPHNHEPTPEELIEYIVKKVLQEAL